MYLVKEPEKKVFSGLKQHEIEDFEKFKLMEAQIESKRKMQVLRM